MNTVTDHTGKILIYKTNDISSIETSGFDVSTYIDTNNYKTRYHMIVKVYHKSRGNIPTILNYFDYSIGPDAKKVRKNKKDEILQNFI